MEPLAAYLPRLQARWPADGESRWMWLEGSLLFADISGFTALSERLARRGRVGAETLTDIVNDVMGRLITAALAHGGDLLKYGGDALLLLFTGPGHEQRSAAAARALLGELRRPTPRPPDAGRARLRMSIGAEAGPIFACMAGEAHKELVVAGLVVS
ncbi:MAG TPA: adenylate/guanylate cyclase domain-containing protein, partial [Acidimicrobiales bacterium]|nr:adenylate/guanylate cyclase domain-containing protein [Acidimicrobiales bacterium]